MTSKMSLFNREIWKQNVRNVGWISIVYLAALLFFLPLTILMDRGKEYEYIPSEMEEGLFFHLFYYEIQLFFLFLMPVLMAVFLFRYMHVRGASDFTHSLPISRKKLFHHQMMSGLFLLLVPIWVVSILLSIMHLTMNVGIYFSFSDLGYWTILMTIVTILVFTSSVLVGVLTGLSAVQAVLTYILLLFPSGILLLFIFQLDIVRVGFPANYIMEPYITAFSPITHILSNAAMTSSSSLGAVEWMVYGGISILFYLTAIVLYQKRPQERAAQAIVFSGLKPIFIFGVTFCFMLLAGTYFGMVQQSYPWIIFGYVGGAVIGYLLAIMLLAKTWRVFSFRYVKGFAVYAVIAAAALGLTLWDWTDYESAIPETEDIEKVYIDSHSYRYTDYSEEELSMIEERESIDVIRKVHEEVISLANPLPGRYSDSLFITYYLKNGKKMHREFNVPVEQMEQKWKMLYTLDEYKKLNYRAIAFPFESIDAMHLDSYGENERIPVYDLEDRKELLSRLEKDIIEASYDELVHPKGVITSLEVIVGNRGEYAPIPQSFSHVGEWLKEQGLYDQVYVKAKDVKEVKVMVEGSNQEFPFTEEEAETISTSEEEKIETVLQTAVDNARDATYTVAIYTYKSDNPMVYYYTEEDAPDWIKSQF